MRRSNGGPGSPTTLKPARAPLDCARGVVQVAIYCHAAASCTGTITLHSRAHGGSRSVWLGAAGFTVASHRTGKARVHLSQLAGA